MRNEYDGSGNVVCTVQTETQFLNDVNNFPVVRVEDAYPPELAEILRRVNRPGTWSVDWHKGVKIVF